MKDLYKDAGNIKLVPVKKPKAKKVKYIAISSQLWGQKNARKEFMVEPELKAFIELLVDRVLEQNKEIENLNNSQDLPV